MNRFSHLLVPLDGSASAEAATVAADYLARSLNSRVTLLHVMEHNPPQQRHHQHHLTTIPEARDYLGQVAARAFTPGVPVDLHVHDQAVHDVARGIADHAAEFTPVLIVMCTHGRSGPGRWAFGSIAQQVVAAGHSPLLLIPDQLRAPFAIASLVIPLDGSPDHETALPLVVGIARAFHASLRLLTVVPHVLDLKGERAAAARAMPFTLAAALSFEQEEAALYLQRLRDTMPPEIQTQCLVRRGDPVHEILTSTDDLPGPLIVMSTHGRTGSQAFWHGSVAPHVALGSRLPILLIPLKPRP